MKTSYPRNVSINLNQIGEYHYQRSRQQQIFGVQWLVEVKRVCGATEISLLISFLGSR